MKREHSTALVASLLPYGVVLLLYATGGMSPTGFDRCFASVAPAKGLLMLVGLARLAERRPAPCSVRRLRLLLGPQALQGLVWLDVQPQTGYPLARLPAALAAGAPARLALAAGAAPQTLAPGRAGEGVRPALRPEAPQRHPAEAAHRLARPHRGLAEDLEGLADVPRALPGGEDPPVLNAHAPEHLAEVRGAV